jgi:multiple sugar transport system permease protein
MAGPTKSPEKRPPKISSNTRLLRRFQVAMVLPALVVLFVVNFAPIADTFITSLDNYFLPTPAARHFVGFANYVALFHDARFFNSLKLTLVYTASVVAIETVLGFVIAILLSRQSWGSKFIRGVLLLPIVLTPITVAFMWRVMFSPTLGIINYLLGFLHIPPQLWIFGPGQALPSLFIVDTWQKTPVMILIFVTAFLALPNQVIEAGEIDGASAWQRLWLLKVPLMKPVLMVGILFQTIDAARLFDMIFILTRGGPGTSTETLSLLTYLNGFGFLKMGYAGASGVILFLIIAVLSQFIIQIGKVRIDQ